MKIDDVPSGFCFVCKTNEIKEKIGKKFIVDDEEIAVFFVDNKFYALSNMCPHQHARIIFDGFIEDDSVVCPAHGWAFNLETGKQSDGRKGLRVFETIVIESGLYVKINKQTFNW